MKKILFSCFAMFYASTGFSVSKDDQDEYMVVTAPMDVDGVIFGTMTGGGGSHGGSTSAGGTEGVGGGMEFSPLVKTGCQECQSSTAFYTCEVNVPVAIHEDPFKTLTKIKNQNCCSSKGGLVLNTRAGHC